MVPSTQTPIIRALRRPAVLAGLLLAILVACGDDNGVDPGERLCGGQAGLGVRVEGKAEPLDICLDDVDVSVAITALDRYDVSGLLQTSSGVYQVQMVFAIRPDAPVALYPVQTINEAVSNPDAVWIYYQEAPNSGDTIESLEVTGGSFQLSFSDANVLAGTFEGITLTMHDIQSGDAVGKRKLAQGFFSLTVKSPTAATETVNR
ncbi:MAG TPA: hypothetical protein VFX92_06080 [Candidatus Krumholzibacteria bacterium]|nr:hypothetical protein [Candidatus Krumholzibacteria bacterium]